MAQHFKIFIFEDITLDRDEGVITMRYALREKSDVKGKQITFEETLTFDPGDIDWSQVNDELLERALLSLHLIGGMSYYKAACPKKIIIKNQTLGRSEAEFWNKLYTRGLGEFFYTNDINFQGLINFPYSEKLIKKPIIADLAESFLVAIGGGKDSIVTAEILKEQDLDFTLFSLQDHEPIRKTAEIISAPRLIFNRQLDSKLFELNEQGAYNGHVPITAYISFLMMIAAVLYDHDSIIFSLERSANEGQLMFHSMDVNHQYSKSEEFEQDFGSYIRAFLTPNINMFSLLRPFYELKIAELFHRFAERKPDYLEHFTSCNTNFRIHKEKGSLWCNECPKCAFVFAILSPFFEKNELINIFGTNLFEKKELVDMYRLLLGIKGSKPFECVGTHEETQAAFLMAHEKGDYEGDAIMKMFVQEALPEIEDSDQLKAKLLAHHESDSIPEPLASIMTTYI